MAKITKLQNLLIKNLIRRHGCPFLLLLFGIALISFRTWIFKGILGSFLVLKNGTFLTNMWQKHPEPISLNFYLFNWTNPEDILNSTTKPIFNELGPYSFDETREKTNLSWNIHNDTVSFNNLKSWTFNPQKSNGTLEDRIVSLNPIALVSAATVKDKTFLIRRVTNMLLSLVGAKVHRTHTVGECLFDGFDDVIMKVTNRMTSIGNSTKFGWFHGRNNSEEYEGRYNMNTGIKGQLGELKFWKYMNRTRYFPGRCAEIEGSAGELFPSDLTKKTVIKLYSTDLCRLGEFEFDEEVDFRGFSAYKYSAQDRLLDNGSKVPENKCFWNNPQQPYGTMDISSCRYGMPAYISLPRFNKADPYYISSVEGIDKPNKDLHDLSLIFEPKTGLPLQISGRLQLNLLLQPVPGMSLYSKVPRIYMPILWFEERAGLPESMYWLLTIVLWIERFCLGIGVMCILISFLVEFRNYYRIRASKVIRKQCVKNDNVLNSTEEVPLRNEKIIEIH